MSLLKVYSKPGISLGWVTLIMLSLYGNFALAQQKETIPDLSRVRQTEIWDVRNREISYHNGEVHLNGKPGDGILWLKDLDFSNGTISFDVKGKDDQGKSFIGLAFHGVNDSTFDAVYFRPFNFHNKDRNKHSVQYISMPFYSWDKLREDHPGRYENVITPIVDPNEWFHVTILVDHPKIKVFVNDSTEPALEVAQLSQHKSGWLGFWVGNNSEGDFRNLKITSAP